MSTQTKARPPHEGATRKGFAAAAPPPSKQRPRAYRFTREQYERMIEAGVLTPEDRCELLEGHIVDKMPQSSRHSNAIRRISRALQPLYPPERHLLNVQLPLAPPDADSEPEPDISVVEGALGEYEDAHPSTALLVVEVSDSSLLRRDGTRKERIYARAGVPAYWIINLEDASLEAYRDPSGDGYDRRETVRPPATLRPPQAETEVAVADLLPR